MQIFIPDGRLTPDGLSAMLTEIGCDIWVSPQDHPCPVKGMHSLIFPPLGNFLEQSSSTSSYPYSETWEQAKDEIMYIIHTSGTTGKPQRCIQTKKRLKSVHPRIC